MRPSDSKSCLKIASSVKLKLKLKPSRSVTKFSIVMPLRHLDAIFRQQGVASLASSTIFSGPINSNFHKHVHMYKYISDCAWVCPLYSAQYVCTESAI